VTGADGQPKPNNDRSSAPDTVRHDDVAAHVPTTSPPQGVKLEQDAPPPPLLALEPDLPPEPESGALGEALLNDEQATRTTAAARRMWV
jgi:hypothetical protein